MIDLLTGLAEHVDEVLGTDHRHYGQMPDDIDTVILYNFKSGISPDYSFTRGDAFRRRPFLQVIVRSPDYMDALGLTYGVQRTLEKTYGNINGHNVLNIRSTADMLENGRDEQGRYKFLINLIVDVNLKEE